MIPEKSRSAKMRTEYPQDIHNGAKYPPCINKLSTRAGREEGTSERESLEAAQDFLNHFKLQLFEKRTDMRSTFLPEALRGSIGNPEKNAEKAEVRIRKGPPHDMPCRKNKEGRKNKKSTASRWKRAYQYPVAQSAPMKNMMIFLEEKTYE